MTRSCRYYIVLAAAALCLVPGAKSIASDDFWASAVHGVWQNGTNWVDGTTPQGGDAALFNLAGGYTVSFNGTPFPIQALTVTSAANATFTSASIFDVSTLQVTSASGSRDVLVTDNATLTLGVAGTFVQPDRPLHLTVGDELKLRNGATLNVGFGSDVVTHVLNIENGGQLNINGSGSLLTNDSFLTVGTSISGVAAMTIQNGGAVFNNVSYVGGATESTGIVTVTGAGSTWSNTAWIVVGAGVGQMIVQDGGSVTSTTGTLGWLAGSNGSVSVSGAGSAWTMSNYLYVGESGAGQLTISAGGSVSNAQSAVLGFNPGSSGAATVTGVGSTWTNSGTLSVGYFDRGSLVIENGGAVSNTIGSVGWNSLSSSTGMTSTATVTGAGSTWTNTSEFFVGGFSQGALTISGGASLSNTNGFVGYGAAPSSDLPNVLLVGNGAVTVTGAGSTWTNNGELNVGNRGTGTLTIEAGGSVTGINAFIGRAADLSHPNPAYRYSSSGAVTVTGADSKWTINGRLSMGGDAIFNSDGGDGTLTISSGGNVSVAQDTVLFPGSLLKLEGGSLATTTFGFQGGQFQWTAGTLHIDTFNDNLTNPAGGTLAPGRSAGSTTIAGNYTQQSGAALEIEIGGTALAMHDFVNVTGTVLLGGELQLKLIDGFTPAATDTFTVLNALGGIAGVFNNINTSQRLTTADGGGSFLVHYGATSAFSPNQVVLTDFVPALPGDYNDDGMVDAADYVVWRDNEGTNNTLPNDPLGGMIGSGQYDNWRAHFGQTAGSGNAQAASHAVPEPGTLLSLQIFAANLPIFWAKFTRRRSPPHSCAQARTPCSD